MTLDELIEHLEEIRDEELSGEGRVEVMLATQPNYPLEASICTPRLVDVNPMNWDDGGCYKRRDDPKWVLYIPEKTQTGYLRGSREEVWS